MAFGQDSIKATPGVTYDRSLFVFRSDETVQRLDLPVRLKTLFSSLVRK